MNLIHELEGTFSRGKKVGETKAEVVSVLLMLEMTHLKIIQKYSCHFGRDTSHPDDRDLVFFSHNSRCEGKIGFR